MSLVNVLDMCQRTQHSHKRGTETLNTLLAAEGTDKQAFLAEFIGHLQRLAVVQKREPAVERLIDFMCKFAAANGPIAIGVLQFAISMHNAKDKAVRFRVCQFMANILKDLEEDTEIEEELWQGLQAALLMRVKDKIAAVRVEAVRALTRLQIPEDESCPVVAEMLRLMSTDSCSSVRDAAVECVCISRLTLPAIMMRVRDVSKDVRTQARGKMMRVVAAGVGEEALNVDDDVEDSVQDTTTVSDE